MRKSTATDVKSLFDAIFGDHIFLFLGLLHRIGAVLENEKRLVGGNAQQLATFVPEYLPKIVVSNSYTGISVSLILQKIMPQRAK